MRLVRFHSPSWLFDGAAGNFDGDPMLEPRGRTGAGRF
jgi:hypothetical protein